MLLSDGYLECNEEFETRGGGGFTLWCILCNKVVVIDREDCSLRNHFFFYVKTNWMKVLMNHATGIWVVELYFLAISSASIAFIFGIFLLGTGPCSLYKMWIGARNIRWSNLEVVKNSREMRDTRLLCFIVTLWRTRSTAAVELQGLVASTLGRYPFRGITQHVTCYAWVISL